MTLRHLLPQSLWHRASIVTSTNKDKSGPVRSQLFRIPRAAQLTIGLLLCAAGLGWLGWTAKAERPNHTSPLAVPATVSATAMATLTVTSAGDATVGAYELGTGPTASTYVVNTTSDSGTGGCTPGECTLREAIEAANTDGTDSTINFNIPGPGPHVITVGSALPTITSPVTINGLSEPDVPGGTCPLPSGALAIQIDGSSTASSTDATGLQLGPGSDGSTIRGLSIANFVGDVAIDIKSGSNNITCNYIGLAANGTTAGGNSYGVSIISASNNNIGGMAAGDGNVIANHAHNGVHIVLNGGSNTVRGNIIRNNSEFGVQAFNNSNGNIIQDNTIRSNGRDGVRIESVTGNRITQNLIYNNGSLGIELILPPGEGVTSNDLGDTDTGSNNGQNFPDITSAITNLINTTINFTLDSNPGNYTIEFFSNPTCDGTHGEGQVYLGSKSVTLPGGPFSITTLPATMGGHVITATAIKESGTGGAVGDTSEFSACLTIISANVPPMFTSCPTNQTVNAASGQCTASVAFSPTANGLPSPSITCAIGGTPITSPYNFPVGTSNVVCSASNGVAPNATCNFSVTVNDTQAPTIGACPTNITQPAATGQCAASVTFTPPTASDNCAGATVTCSPAPGSSFPLGTTTVSCTSRDAANNAGTACTFTVTVQDTQAPAITCPGNITVSNAQGQCSAVVTYTTPTATDNCPGATVSCTPPSGSTFQVGVTTVTCTASDASPNSPDTTCTFTVRVNDAQAPTITCPANIFLGTAGTSAVATWNPPTVSDNCPGVGAPTCSPASGSSFNVGVTTVTCTVADAANNTASCSFQVTVNRVSASISDPLACTGPGNKLTVTLNISNNGNVNQNVVDTTTFTNMVGLPNTCVASVGTCTVTNAGVSYTGTLTPGQTAVITYMGQVSDLATPGSQVCANNSVTFNGGPAVLVPACTTVTCPAPGPGGIFPATSEAGDQKAGSVLVYNIYTSGATSGNTQNTRINITNMHPLLSSFVHLFFVAEGCSIADSYICLTGNQTASFLASDLDPGTTGYLVAVAVNQIGCPTSHNYLIGDEYVKFSSGHAANLGAEAFAQLAGGLPACDGNSVTATLNFDGVSYNRVPAVLALDSVGSRADGNDTLLIINRIGGNLGIGASTLSTIFGILYDDAENSLSFSVSGNCQLRNSLSNNFPRTTPRFETFIPAGRTGWLKIFNQTAAIGITGSAINFNANAASSAGAFNQGHNLHHLTLNATSVYTIPLFPPSC